MSQSEGSDNRGRGAGLVDSLRSVSSKNPETEKLLQSLEGHLGVQSEKLVGSLGDKVGGTTKKLTDVANGNAEPSRRT